MSVRRQDLCARGWWLPVESLNMFCEHQRECPDEPHAVALMQGSAGIFTVVVFTWVPSNFVVTYLQTAIAGQGHVETARLLLDAKANVNAKLTDGSTPLALASWKGHLEVVRLLLMRGANFRVRCFWECKCSQDSHVEWRNAADTLYALVYYEFSTIRLLATCASGRIQGLKTWVVKKDTTTQWCHSMVTTLRMSRDTGSISHGSLLLRSGGEE